MRRISLALALLGAAASAGCGGGTNPSSSGSGKGIPGSTFTVKVRGEKAFFDPATSTTVFLPDNGLVTASAGGSRAISCGYQGGVASTICSADYPWGDAQTATTVTVTATGATGYAFHAFAGSCTGDTCVVTGNAERLVLVRFAQTAEGLGGHPNYSSPALHGPAFRLQSLACDTCHGANLQGQGLAVACASCHDGSPAFPITFPAAPSAAIQLGGHFDVAGAAWGDHGASGWSRACLRCHTNQGAKDYVGADGSADYLTGTFNTTSALNSTSAACVAAGTCVAGAYAYGPLKCDSCHNSASEPTAADPGGITSILFVSGLQVRTDKSSAVCGQCHQGRESTTSVNTKIGATGLDTQIAGTANSFPNPHYLGAAATLFGANAAGWAQYPAKTYTGTFAHGGLNGCTYCHDAHSGHVDVTASTCGRCHNTASGARVANLGELELSRQVGWRGDIDGDGAVEGLNVELEDMATTLYAAMRAYATSVVGTSIVYDGNSHPYYFVDSNGNGVRDGYVDGQAIVGFDPALADSTQFKKFTPRLVRAAFNYKWEHAEPGAWAHNAQYAVEILFDAIADLNAGLVAAGQTAVPFSGFRSIAPAAFTLGGHFEASGHASAGCGRCHAGDGFRDFIGADGSASGVLTIVYPSGSGAQMNAGTWAEGFTCNACHNPVSDPIAGGTWTNQKKFPSGKIVTTDKVTAICAQCHDGGRPGYEVSALIAKAGTTAADTQLPTSNSVVRAHYLPAASTLFGADAANWYQYPGQIYTARNQHGGKASCTDCHDAHSGHLPADADIAAKCGTCHFNEAGASVTSFLELEEVRQFGFEGDIDGDAVEESLKAEIDGLGGSRVLGDAAVRHERRRREHLRGGQQVLHRDQREYCLQRRSQHHPVQQVHAASAPRRVQLPHVAERRRRVGAQPAVRGRGPVRRDRGPEPRARRERGDDPRQARVQRPLRRCRGPVAVRGDDLPLLRSGTPATRGSPPRPATSATAARAGSLSTWRTPASLTTLNKVTAMQCTTCHAPAPDGYELHDDAERHHDHLLPGAEGGGAADRVGSGAGRARTSRRLTGPA